MMDDGCWCFMMVANELWLWLILATNGWGWIVSHHRGQFEQTFFVRLGPERTLGNKRGTHQRKICFCVFKCLGHAANYPVPLCCILLRKEMLDPKNVKCQWKAGKPSNLILYGTKQIPNTPRILENTMRHEPWAAGARRIPLGSRARKPWRPGAPRIQKCANVIIIKKGYIIAPFPILKAGIGSPFWSSTLVLQVSCIDFRALTLNIISTISYFW